MRLQWSRRHDESLTESRKKRTMEPSEDTSSDQKPRQTENGQPLSCQLPASRAPGNRFFSCLMIAAVFILLDLVILLYFLWPLTAPKDVDQVSPAPSGIEKEINESSGPDGLQRKQ